MLRCKKYSDFGGGKKNNKIQIFLLYELMLNPGKKISLCATKKINSCVVGRKNSERNKKPYPPLFKLNGRSLI